MQVIKTSGAEGSVTGLSADGLVCNLTLPDVPAYSVVEFTIEPQWTGGSYCQCGSKLCDYVLFKGFAIESPLCLYSDRSVYVFRNTTASNLSIEVNVENNKDSGFNLTYRGKIQHMHHL